MTQDEAVLLVQRAICAGIFNDLGSGSNVDVNVIKTDQTVEIHRNMITPNNIEPLRASVRRSGRLTMRPGLTPILSETFTPHPVAPASRGGADDMEVEE